MSYRWTFPVTAILIIIADQITKLLIVQNISYGKSLHVCDHLSISYVHNTGAAFGLFTDHTLLLTILAIIGLIVILFLYRQFSQSSTFSSLTIGLIFGGAAGNIIDRIRLSYVIDFITVRLWKDVYWPSFNIADSAITIGVILLVLFMLTGFGKKDEHPA